FDKDVAHKTPGALIARLLLAPDQCCTGESRKCVQHFGFRKRIKLLNPEQGNIVDMLVQVQRFAQRIVDLARTQHDLSAGSLRLSNKDGLELGARGNIRQPGCTVAKPEQRFWRNQKERLAAFTPLLPT